MLPLTFVGRSPVASKSSIGPTNEPSAGKASVVENAASHRASFRVRLGKLPLPTCLQPWLSSLAPGVGNAVAAIQAVAKEPACLSIAAPKAHASAFYRHQSREHDLFAKVRTALEQTADARGERISAWAGELRLAPRTYEAPAATRTTVCDFVPAEELSFAQTQDPHIRGLLVDAMRTLHAASAPVAPLEGEDPIELLGLEQMNPARPTNRPQCDLLALSRRAGWALEQLGSMPVHHVLCHFDPLRRNMFFYQDNLLMVDWELARFADPLRDLAKFFGFNHLAAKDTHGILCRYYLGPPAADDSRRFSLWMLIMSIDHYAWKVSATGGRTTSIRRKIEHIADLSSLLPDAPPCHFELAQRRSRPLKTARKNLPAYASILKVAAKDSQRQSIGSLPAPR